MRSEPWLLRISVQIYGLLVCLYPPSFRRQYGDSMRQLFRDASRDAYRESGSIGFLGFVVACIGDFFQSFVREHGESIMVDSIRFRRIVSRAMPAFWMALAALSSGLWLASTNDSIGLFRLSNDSSLRFTRGVMEFRQIDAKTIEAPIPREQFHEAAIARQWLAPPEPAFPGFGFSSGHVLGMGGTGAEGDLLATIAPVEYSLLRVPLWIFLLPFVVWSGLFFTRRARNMGQAASLP